jgi:hypothetical protein
MPWPRRSVRRRSSERRLGRRSGDRRLGRDRAHPATAPTPAPPDAGGASTGQQQGAGLPPAPPPAATGQDAPIRPAPPTTRHLPPGPWRGARRSVDGPSDRSLDAADPSRRRRPRRERRRGTRGRQDARWVAPADAVLVVTDRAGDLHGGRDRVAGRPRRPGGRQPAGRLPVVGRPDAARAFDRGWPSRRPPPRSWRWRLGKRRRDGDPRSRTRCSPRMPPG